MPQDRKLFPSANPDLMSIFNIGFTGLHHRPYARNNLGNSVLLNGTKFFCGYFGEVVHRNLQRFDKQTNEPVSPWRWPSPWLVNISIIFLGNITMVFGPGLTRWDETPAEINLFLVFCVWQVFTNNHDQRARPSLDLYWSLPNFPASKKGRVRKIYHIIDDPHHTE